jgi:transposase
LQYRNSGGKNFPKTLASHYSNLNQKYQEILAALKQGRKRSIEADSMFQALKGTKSQVEARKTEDVWNIVKPFFRGRGIKPLVMHRLEPKDFQIKNLSNDIRMGMKNYFSSDPKIVMQELEKIKGTIFVIFDDNISGGATLSDICLQAKQLGIEYIIPITFGEMQKKYNLGIGKQINMPSKNGNFQNYS